MTERALSFGSVAATYERFRPGYPDELVDGVLAYAGRPVHTALEIGAGTGKATRAFATRGVAVTATDPDPSMLAELRRHVPASVVTVEGALEDLAIATTFDLVFAAAALHWTDPTRRWPRVAALLEPEGTFASFGGQQHLADPEVEAAVVAARAPFMDSDDVPAPDGSPDDGPMRWPGTELLSADGFSDVRQVVIERRTTLPAADYVGHLSTVSAYLVLPEDVREQVLERILDVLPDEVDLVGDLVAHLARLG